MFKYMNMKKFNIILVIVVLLMLCSCTRPVLNSKEYKVIDTLRIDYDNFNKIVGAKVIVKYEDSYHYGVLDKWGNLTEMNPRNLQIDRFK